MGFLDKVLDTVTYAAATVNTEPNTAAKRQDEIELKKLQNQIDVIKQELDASYVQIGRKYADYVIATQEMGSVDISDILKMMQPKISQKQELEKQYNEIRKKMKDADVLREKEQIEREYIAEKEKLDQALAMDVLSQAEYDERLRVAHKKVENFEEIRRIDKQFDMHLISLDERNSRIAALLS